MADFYIHHFGQLTETESRLQKAAVYRDLLRLKVEELPDDPMAWLQLGLQEYECSRESAEPMRCLERALALEPKATQVRLFKGMILLDAGKFSEALAALDNLGPGPGSALCQHLRGDALHNLGRFQEAHSAYAEAAKLSSDDPVVISKLGYTEIRLGMMEPGIARLQRAASAAPQLADVQERLMKAYVAVGRWTRAAEQAEKWAAVEATPKAYLRAVSIRVYLKQNHEAREFLFRGMDLFPDSPDLQRACSELGGQRQPDAL